jgi:hypothetical protein
MLADATRRALRARGFSEPPAPANRKAARYCGRLFYCLKRDKRSKIEVKLKKRSTQILCVKLSIEKTLAKLFK